MKIKVFTKNKDGKIEFAEDELKKLLDEVYWEGYNDGRGWPASMIRPDDYYNYCSQGERRG